MTFLSWLLLPSSHGPRTVHGPPHLSVHQTIVDLYDNLAARMRSLPSACTLSTGIARRFDPLLCIHPLKPSLFPPGRLGKAKDLKKTFAADLTPAQSRSGIRSEIFLSHVPSTHPLCTHFIPAKNIYSIVGRVAVGTCWTFSSETHIVILHSKYRCRLAQDNRCPFPLQWLSGLRCQAQHL